MAARKKTKTPEPVAITTICSVCGLLWHDHGEDPTTDDCIRLLKAELAKKPITVPQPYPVPSAPYQPYIRPWYWENWYDRRPYGWQPRVVHTTGITNESTFGGKQFTEHTPKLLSTSCQAVGSTL